jgi:hypothetical protein
MAVNATSISPSARTGFIPACANSSLARKTDTRRTSATGSLHSKPPGIGPTGAGSRRATLLAFVGGLQGGIAAEVLGTGAGDELAGRPRGISFRR